MISLLIRFSPREMDAADLTDLRGQVLLDSTQLKETSDLLRWVGPAITTKNNKNVKSINKTKKQQQKTKK